MKLSATNRLAVGGWQRNAVTRTSTVEAILAGRARGVTVNISLFSTAVPNSASFAVSSHCVVLSMSAYNPP